MFCSPIQQADPFAYWSPSPSYGYSRQPSYHHCDPYTRAIMHEQARREQARREAIAQRRAYEAYMRKEAARRRAAEEEAAAAEYRQAVMDRILKAYAAQAHAQQEEEEQEQVQATQSQSRIPISSFASDRGSEYEHEQDEASDEEEDEEPAQCHTPPLAFQNLEKELARDLPSNETKISYEEAVAIVQKHAQAALLIRRRLAALNKVRESFLAQQRAFRPPRTLDFDLPKSQSSNQPTLAYTPNNRPLQAYEENLLRLLTDLDDIPSGGYNKVKRERKALARTIQSELDKIDAYKMQQWQRRR